VRRGQGPRPLSAPATGRRGFPVDHQAPDLPSAR